ncbi:MAG: xanthomonadin transporter [Rudaea sp.]|uniref:MMPL family transporter n=1 Tax=unclassified Rudaea TaxID=2627037 RepID=UPI0010F53BA5|nr:MULTISPECIES: xanthomonadin transporter [unclassified Rudaea]MBN8885286.1 xanthomonadin transporter [Rudaea sp.]
MWLRRIFLVTGWLVGLALLAFVLARNLVVTSDLRAFMPPPRNADQKLLLEQIGEGPASRLLLLEVAPEQATFEQTAELSRGLVQALHGDAHFTRVMNGEGNLAELDPALLPYRYLLSPTLDTHRFDADFLRDELQQRIEDLASPAAGMLKPWLARDPTLETLKLAQRWTPAKAPVLRDGVWAAPDGGALLLVETAAPAFDPAAQGEVVETLRAKFRALPGSENANLEISGPGYFSVLVNANTRREAEWLSGIGTAAFALLLLVAYRHPGALLSAALPIASGALAGIAATTWVFGPVHGITLAFGFTLLGVAQEYPLRLLSHRRAGVGARESLLGVWPLLRLAIASACIAYLAFFASGVSGLQQLAMFTIAGLIVAGFATRSLLPAVLPVRFRDVAESPWLERLRVRLDAVPRLRLVSSGALPWALLALACVALVLAPKPFWQNDLAALTPVPAKLLQREGELRSALGAPDVRYLLVLEANDADGVLALSERISPQVEKWIAGKLVDDVELPSRYLPSVATQAARQAELPDRATLQATLDAAAADTEFQAELFAPFVDDVEKARGLPPLTPKAFAATPLGARLDAMLAARGGRALGLGTLSGVHDPVALADAVAQLGNGVRLIDLKAASESLVADYRARIGIALLVALVLLAVTVAVAFRDLVRAWHVIAPMSLATLLVLAVLRAGGVSLSLFHLVALTLAAGLGLHYALFFERRVDDAAEARRTLHATLICVISAVLVFGLLATSQVPVLRAIGLTVALGVAFHFCLSTIMARNSQGCSLDTQKRG